MTEAEWLASDDPLAMLSWLLGTRDAPSPHTASGIISYGVEPHPSASDRKLRLFALAAGCEKCVDACRGDRAVEYASYVCTAVCGSGRRDAQAALLRDIVGNPFRPTLADCELSSKPDGVCWHHSKELVRVEEGVWMCPAGRAYFVRHFRTSTVLAIAQAAYDERLHDGTLDSERLAVLSDALEEAGCPDGEASPLLTHLRSPGPHVRGCWVLDLILGQE